MASSNGFKYQRQLNLWALLIIAAAVAVYFAAFDMLRPLSGGGFIPEDALSRQAMINGLSRTAVTLIFTVFACLFLAIPITANMYTPQLIHIFVKSPTNQIVLGIFVFSAGHAVWTSRIAGGTPAPEWQLVLSLGLVTLTMVLLLPYLFSVFRFLEPRAIVARVSREVIKAMAAPVRGRPFRRQHHLSRGVRNLGNLILRALDRADRDVAIYGVEALDHCAEEYLEIKGRHHASWFAVGEVHFPGFSTEAIALVNRDRIWVEMELLLQLNRAYSAALAKVPDVISAITRSHRLFALAAAQGGDSGSLDLSLRYFNNFLREAIKKQDIHAVYDLLYQYRVMAVHLWDLDPQKVLRLAKWLKYYAGMAAGAGLPFAYDLVSYDLGRVVTSVDPKRPEFDRLVDAFLAIKGPAREGVDLPAGMFKARLITTALLAEKGLAKASQKVEASLRQSGTLSRTTGAQLLEEEEEFFWEVTDRQHNLDYVRPETRRHIRAILERL